MHDDRDKPSTALGDRTYLLDASALDVLTDDAVLVDVAHGVEALTPDQLLDRLAGSR